jgi:hypothetical protein
MAKLSFIACDPSLYHQRICDFLFIKLHLAHNQAFKRAIGIKNDKLFID